MKAVGKADKKVGSLVDYLAGHLAPYLVENWAVTMAVLTAALMVDYSAACSADH